jgi:hypothetical protein
MLGLIACVHKLMHTLSPHTKSCKFLQAGKVHTAPYIR